MNNTSNTVSGEQKQAWIKPELHDLAAAQTRARAIFDPTEFTTTTYPGQFTTVIRHYGPSFS